MAGVWGLLAVGLFDTVDGSGLLVGGGIDQFVAQAIGVVAIITWTFLTSSAVFWTIKLTVGLRVSAADEIAGLDRIEHGAQAYPEFMERLADPEVLDPVA